MFYKFFLNFHSSHWVCQIISAHGHKEVGNTCAWMELYFCHFEVTEKLLKLEFYELQKILIIKC